MKKHRKEEVKEQEEVIEKRRIFYDAIKTTVIIK
jgi:hypothetical protein